MVETQKMSQLNISHDSLNGMASAPRIKAYVEDITPDMARHYLGLNEHNRTINKASVARLAEVILRGEWVENGEAIKFDVNGKLIDGQHRLAAIVRAGVSVPMLVVRNAPITAQDTIDTGTKRNLGSQLRIRGEQHSSGLAAAISWIHRLNLVRAGKSLPVGGNAYPTIPSGVLILVNNPGIRSSVKFAAHVAGRIRLPLGVTGALHYEFSNLDQEDCEDFFQKLLSGANLDEGDPVLVFRRWWERHLMQSTRASNTAVRQSHIAAIMIKAWNAYREGRTVTRLTWSPGGSKRESFPLPR